LPERLKSAQSGHQGDHRCICEKNRPKFIPIYFHQTYCTTFTVAKKCPTIGATSVMFIKLPKVNYHPLGENSPNLVTLLVTLFLEFVSKFASVGSIFRTPRLKANWSRKRFPWQLFRGSHILVICTNYHV
jgi:hypothetical protein